ncbi:MAG: hypothetical protein M5U05_18820 [Anaerolineales bacterium]|nr:hypothetical protein [Anaerolineales bacterium]
MSKSGNDTTGDGLTWETAWKTVTKAYTALGSTPNVCIFIGEGIWGWNDGWSNATQSVTRSFVGVGNVEIDTYYIVNPYSLTTGKMYTYESTGLVGPISSVLDYGHRDSDGIPSLYATKTTIDDVEATAGSFYYDTVAKILYVHTLNESAPDANVRSQYMGSNFLSTNVSGVQLYAENFKVYRTPTSISSSGGITYLNNVHLGYIGMSFTNNTTAILRDCSWRSSLKMGVATQEDLLYGSAAKIIEIDCEGSYSGGSTYIGSNATTNHDAGENVIINGEYHHTYGPPIGFIGNGKCWLLGTYSHDNLATSANYYSYQLDEAVAYLDCCRSSGSVKDIGPMSEIVHVRDFIGGATSDASLVAY